MLKGHQIHLMTDARNLYDKLYRATPTVKGAEKRSSIEATGLRENLENGETSIHWVSQSFRRKVNSGSIWS